MAEGSTSAVRPVPPRIARGGWLDLLRFVVGALIILYHFRNAGPVPLGDLHPAFDRGYLLTDFFIIDSGYVLARIYGDRLAAGSVSLGDYARQRLWRVVPAHLAVSLALVLLVVAASVAGVSPSNPKWFDWSQLPAQVLLVQSYGVPGGQGWNAPTWTLSALIGCYLCLPWICRILWRARPFVVLASAVTILLMADAASRVWLGDPIYHLPMRYGFVRALPLFLLGVAVAQVGSRLHVSANIAKAVGASAVVALIAVQTWGGPDLVSLALLTVIIWAAGAIPVIKPSRLIEHLALMSFAMFLTNEVTRIACFGVMEALGQEAWSAPARWGVWLAGLVGAFVAAAVFRYGFDKPVQDLLTRRSRHRTPVAATPETALTPGLAG